MKALLFFGSIVFLLGCSDGASKEAQIGDKTTFSVDRVVFDAGEVKKGEMITAKFKITNTGKNPLVFGAVNASCSCTVAEKPEEPVQPGESTVIVAYLNTDKVHNLGLVERNISVIANTEPDLTRLKIRAVIRN